jgi:ribonuclease HI
MMEKIYIYTDGSSRGNPGPAAIGVYITDAKDAMIQEAAEAIGNATDTFAEYQAVLRGLQTVEEMYKEKTKEMEFELCLSSELAKQQLNGECQIKDAGLVPHFIEIHNLRVSVVPNLILTHVPREKHKVADQLVKEALDAGTEF